MKRRGFLAFMGGAAVAGPGMAKEAAAKAAAELGMNGGGMLMGGGPLNPAGSVAGGFPVQQSLMSRAAASVNLLRSLTRDQKAELRRRFGDVHRLDPDLASYHSMSMSARIEMQRDRNVEAYLRGRKSWWEGVLDRGDDEYSTDPLNDI